MKRGLINFAFPLLLTSTVFLAAPREASAALITNLVSHYKFDESSGNAADSVGSNTLTNNNTVTFVSGVVNSAAHFVSASSQSFSIADGSQSGLDFSGDFTAAGFFKPTTAVLQPFVGKRNPTGNNRSYNFFWDTSNTLNLETWTDGSTPACSVSVSWTPTNGTQYAVGVSKSGTTVKFYVGSGGSLAQQGADQTCSSATIFNGTADFEVGSLAQLALYGNMDLDIWSLWSRALTLTELQTYYNAGAGCQHDFAACEGGSAVINLIKPLMFWW